MPDIKDQKLLYHLTALDNVPSILRFGLLPRASLSNFADIADAEIINGRRDHGLEHYVPFHWFARNPFDGRVQRDHPETSFVLISVRRTLAVAESWKVIPRHPLASAAPQLLDYQAGFGAIDWNKMNQRDYHDSECKSICMAECVSPRPVLANEFFRIYAPNEQVAQAVRNLINVERLQLEVEVIPGMFN